MLKEMLPGRPKRNEIKIPSDDAVGFFFNEEHSSRSWTELRLFYLKYRVVLPTRNVVDEEKRKLLPPITVEEIKTSVEDTVKGKCQN